jgi:hypothetical protein
MCVSAGVNHEAARVANEMDDPDPSRGLELKG